MEEVIARMQDEKSGIPIRTVKSFLTKIPSVFSGESLCLETNTFRIYQLLMMLNAKHANLIQKINGIKSEV